MTLLLQVTLVGGARVGRRIVGFLGWTVAAATTAARTAATALRSAVHWATPWARQLGAWLEHTAQLLGGAFEAAARAVGRPWRAIAATAGVLWRAASRSAARMRTRFARTATRVGTVMERLAAQLARLWEASAVAAVRALVHALGPLGRWVRAGLSVAWGLVLVAVGAAAASARRFRHVAVTGVEKWLHPLVRLLHVWAGQLGTAVATVVREAGAACVRFIKAGAAGLVGMVNHHRRVLTAPVVAAGLGVLIASRAVRSGVLRGGYVAAVLTLEFAVLALPFYLVWRLSRPESGVRRWLVRVSHRASRMCRVAWIQARERLASVPQPEPVPARPAVRRTAGNLGLFRADLFQNEYLSAGSREVHAVIAVENGAAGTPGMAETAAVFLLDCSGSMGEPWSKLGEACRATELAIDLLPDGAWFAILRCSHVAEPVYPAARVRAAAKQALGLLWPEGGTAMGLWLLGAREVLSSRPQAIGHAILLTDGRDESESPEELDAALAACRGSFRCDCRGVGDDWEVAELRRIASAMLGTVDIVADPALLAADFQATVVAALARSVAGLSLHVWTPRDSRIRSIRQVAPTFEDLTARRIRIDERTSSYPTGAWAAESREYHLCLEVPAQPLGAELLAARVSVIADGATASTCLVRAVWSEDEVLTGRVESTVTHYAAQADLAMAIQHGLESRRSGDAAAATELLGRAANLAALSGNIETLRLLAEVVELVDAEAGTVRLRPQVKDVDEMTLDTRSTRTVRLPKTEPDRRRRPEQLTPVVAEGPSS